MMKQRPNYLSCINCLHNFLLPSKKIKIAFLFIYYYYLYLGLGILKSVTDFDIIIIVAVCAAALVALLILIAIVIIICRKKPTNDKYEYIVKRILKCFLLSFCVRVACNPKP